MADITHTPPNPPPLDPDTVLGYCRELESGRIVLFAETPFEFPAEERSFLLKQRQSEAQFHKNVAYRPLQDRVTGAGEMKPEEARRLHEILRSYSRRVQDFLGRFLQPYAADWRLDYASFRPFQEQGRELRTRARNDLLHVDSFPTRPTNGDRILRFFTNINPDEPRQWVAGGPFEEVVQTFSRNHRVPMPQALRGLRRLRWTAGRLARRAGVPTAGRPPYDEFMLRLHHAMKEDAGYQDASPKAAVSFAPGSSWIVFTDLVPHAALSGQFALEQTFIIDRHSLVLPEASPLAILERISGASPLVQS